MKLMTSKRREKYMFQRRFQTNRKRNVVKIDNKFKTKIRVNLKFYCRHCIDKIKIKCINYSLIRLQKSFFRKYKAFKSDFDFCPRCPRCPRRPSFRPGHHRRSKTRTSRTSRTSRTFLQFQFARQLINFGRILQYPKYSFREKILEVITMPKTPKYAPKLKINTLSIKYFVCPNLSKITTVYSTPGRYPFARRG